MYKILKRKVRKKEEHERMNKKRKETSKNKKKLNLVNYDILKNNSYLLKENDIFSIRRYGKFQYIRIKKETKNKNYIIECKKYK